MTYLEWTDDDLDGLSWLFRYHLPEQLETRDVTVYAHLHGNEDCPERVECFDGYREIVAKFERDESGNLQRIMGE